LANAPHLVCRLHQYYCVWASPCLVIYCRGIDNCNKIRYRVRDPLSRGFLSLNRWPSRQLGVSFVVVAQGSNNRRSALNMMIRQGLDPLANAVSPKLRNTLAFGHVFGAILGGSWGRIEAFQKSDGFVVKSRPLLGILWTVPLKVMCASPHCHWPGASGSLICAEAASFFISGVE
jgi:hypothetical protein